MQLDFHHGLPAAGERSAVFGQRCIRPRSALGHFFDGSNTARLLPRHAVQGPQAASISTTLGATRDVHHRLRALCKGPRKNNFPFSAADPSRLAALDHSFQGSEYCLYAPASRLAGAVRGFDPDAPKGEPILTRVLRTRAEIRQPSERRCILPDCVARRVHTPGMRAPRAWPGRRLDTQKWPTYFCAGPKPTRGATVRK